MFRIVLSWSLNCMSARGVHSTSHSDVMLRGRPNSGPYEFSERVFICCFRKNVILAYNSNATSVLRFFPKSVTIRTSAKLSYGLKVRRMINVCTRLAEWVSATDPCGASVHVAAKITPCSASISDRIFY